MRTQSGIDVTVATSEYEKGKFSFHAPEMIGYLTLSQKDAVNQFLDVIDKFNCFPPHLRKRLTDAMDTITERL